MVALKQNISWSGKCLLWPSVKSPKSTYRNVDSWLHKTRNLKATENLTGK